MLTMTIVLSGLYLLSGLALFFTMELNARRSPCAGPSWKEYVWMVPFIVIFWPLMAIFLRFETDMGEG